MYEELVVKWAEYYYKNKHTLRKGQSLMNFLRDTYPDLYYNTTDCFYNDALITDTLKDSKDILSQKIKEG